MAAEVRVVPSAEAIGERLAAEIGERHDSGDGPLLLGCPGGRSLRTTYAAMTGRRWERLVVVMMDEYAAAADGRALQLHPLRARGDRRAARHSGRAHMAAPRRL